MNKLLRLVAWCEILTGTFMLIHLVGFRPALLGNAAWLKEGTLIGLGMLGLLAGSALFRRSKSGWGASVALQVLLIPVLCLGAIVFRPGLGLFLPFGVNLPAAASASSLFEFSLGVDFAVSLGAVQAQQYVAVNLAAVACLAILLQNRPVANKTI
jgi:hypothetical protein